jgi:glucose 1-dehydrogenase
MRAITVRPGQEGSLRVADVPEPSPEAGAVLVEGLALGVCGTDREIAAGEYGGPAPRARRRTRGADEPRCRRRPDTEALLDGLDRSKRSTGRSGIAGACPRPSLQ